MLHHPSEGSLKIFALMLFAHLAPVNDWPMFLHLLNMEKLHSQSAKERVALKSNYYFEAKNPSKNSASRVRFKGTLRGSRGQKRTRISQLTGRQFYSERDLEWSARPWKISRSRPHLWENKSCHTHCCQPGPLVWWSPSNSVIAHRDSHRRI